jgi:hypothetical protein
MAVSLDKYPGLCFFLLDANEEGSTDSVSSTGVGNQQDTTAPGLIQLSGMSHSTLTGAATAFGGLTMDDFVER